MIESFGDRETELVWNGEFSRRLPPPIQEPALTKLRLLNAAVRLENLAVSRETGWNLSMGRGRGSIVSESTVNGASVSGGTMGVSRKLKSLIITKI